MSNPVNEDQKARIEDENLQKSVPFFGPVRTSPGRQVLIAVSSSYFPIENNEDSLWNYVKKAFLDPMRHTCCKMSNSVPSGPPQEDKSL